MVKLLNRHPDTRGKYVLLSIVTFLSPVIGMSIIISYLLSNVRKQFNPNDKYLVLPLALLFASFGYCMSFHYGADTDLLRYFDELQTYKTYKSWKDVTKVDLQMLYTRDIFFYFISLINDVHILPFIVGFGIYSIVLYVFFDFISRAKQTFSHRDIVAMLIIIIGVFSPYSLIGNTRCIFAFVMVAFATYRDLVQKKRNVLTLFFYIVPLGLHAAAISILFLRFVQFILKFTGKYILFVALLLPMGINFAYEHFYSDSFIGHFVRKAYFYLNWTDGDFASEILKSKWNIVERFYGVFFISISFFLVFLYEKKRGQSLLAKPMVRFLFLVSTCALGSLYIQTGAFWRYTALLVLFSPNIIIPMFELNSPIFRSMFNILFYSVILMIILNTLRLFVHLDMMTTLSEYASFSGLKLFVTTLL